MLAVKKLAEIQKNSETRNTRKKPPSSQDMVAIESPPPDSGECMSPKMTTFQVGIGVLMDLAESESPHF